MPLNLYARGQASTMRLVPSEEAEHESVPTPGSAGFIKPLLVMFLLCSFCLFYFFLFCFEIRNVYFHRTNLLICCLSLVHKSLFIIDIIEILSLI